MKQNKIKNKNGGNEKLGLPMTTVTTAAAPSQHHSPEKYGHTSNNVDVSKCITVAPAKTGAQATATAQTNMA